MKAALTRVTAVAGKEFKHLRRDPRALATVLILPVLQLLLFAYAISFDVKNVPTVVLDQDNTPASRQYLQTYLSSEFFDVLGSANDLAQIDQLFDQNKVRIAVIIPSGFAHSLDLGEKAQVAVLTDGSEPTSAQLGQAYAIALNASYSQRVAVEWADRQGLDLAQAGEIEPRLRTWYNPEQKSSDFLIPGLMVVIIMIVTIQQTAVTLVREREQGTGEQMTVSPLRRGELMVGKLLPWTLLAFADMLVIALVGIWVFDLPLRGSLGFLAASSVVFVFSALGLGLIISAVAPNLETANIVGLLIAFLPAFLLSGFAFPLESIPTPLQWLSYAFPGRYMVTISRGV
ncbi:MAG TPA: ABC transporter permease, partial [Propionibacteriaceae bacterium]|nr:ABC transporter permease [Propionibacteriaceae bacterium]